MLASHIKSQVSPRGICGGKNGTGPGYSISTLISPCQ